MPRLKHWTPGNVVEIDLNGTWAYGQVIDDPLMGFYPGRSSRLADLEQLNDEDYSFRIWVMKYAIGRNGWPIVGNVELTEKKMAEPWFFKNDPISGALTKYLGSTQEEILTSLEDCAALECAAVWDPEHVESRLQDELAGRPNVWVESLKPGKNNRAQQGEEADAG